MHLSKSCARPLQQPENSRTRRQSQRPRLSRLLLRRSRASRSRGSSLTLGRETHVQRDEQLRDLSILKMNVRGQMFGFSTRNANVRGEDGVFAHVAATFIERGAILFSRCAHVARSRRTLAVGAHRFPEEKKGRLRLPPVARLFIAGIASPVRWPNQALEPTSGTVTSRAAARLAPVPPMAHL